MVRHLKLAFIYFIVLFFLFLLGWPRISCWWWT